MSNLVRTIIPVFALIFCSPLLFGQDQSIELRNPSFEGTPYAGSNENYFKAPRGWYNCGKPNETPPDIQPNLDPFGAPFFEVTTKAQDENTYLGLVVRDNDTWEAVGQRLKLPLESGKCYEFSLYLARSERYVSDARDGSGMDVNHNQPAVIRIYGGNGYCQKKQLLDETGVIRHTKWKKYSFKFEPNSRMNFLLIEAFYKTPTLLPYNGNVLVDHLSNIELVPCDEELPVEEPVEELVASNDKVIPEEKINVKPPPKTPNPAPKEKEIPTTYEEEVKPNTPKPPPPKTLKPNQPKKLKKGQTIRIDKLYFAVDDSMIRNDSYEALDEIYRALSQYKNVVVEIQGHTNSNCDASFCNRLSTARAKAVADYFYKKGIDRNRLKYKGFGKRKPIASNKYAAGRKKNQRVEIKILSLDG